MTAPARWGRRRTLLDLMDKLHLARPATHAYELTLSARSQLAERHGGRMDNGLPLPPARLRAQVGPLHADADFFLRSGRQHAELIRELVRDAGTPVDEVGPILDWGCGCGRVLRHWRDLPAARVQGCDINPKMIEWCAANLPFTTFVTELSPPLPISDQTLGLIYAFSVFTHLSEDLQHGWIAESARVLRPGGFLLLSTLGDHYASLDRLSDEERRRFERGELVVLYERSAGTSLCSAYHPADYVHTKLAHGFDVVGFRPAGDDGLHDIHLLRKR
jgi:SAM-dependent methyltransferase